jgi:hypothetical protein
MTLFKKISLFLYLFAFATFFASCSSSGQTKMKHTEWCRIRYENAEELFKKGNSIFCVDENYEVHNINELDSTALRTMLWQLITDKEKKEIALEHLYTIMSYLKEL